MRCGVSELNRDASNVTRLQLTTSNRRCRAGTRGSYPAFHNRTGGTDPNASDPHRCRTHANGSHKSIDRQHASIDGGGSVRCHGTCGRDWRALIRRHCRERASRCLAAHRSRTLVRSCGRPVKGNAGEVIAGRSEISRIVTPVLDRCSVGGFHCTSVSGHCRSRSDRANAANTPLHSIGGSRQECCIILRFARDDLPMIDFVLPLASVQSSSASGGSAGGRRRAAVVNDLLQKFHDWQHVSKYRYRAFDYGSPAFGQSWQGAGDSRRIFADLRHAVHTMCALDRDRLQPVSA